MKTLAEIVQRRASQESQLDQNIHPVLKRVLANRGITRAEQVDFSLANLPDPFLLKGMQQAVERLYQAWRQQEKIIIVGDFDVDGATSVTVLILGLQAMGFKQVEFELPDRFYYGYGLSAAIVDDLAPRKAGLLITVDTGIASIDGVALANQHGMDVIITDHHLPAEQLPEALAIVNPNQQGCEFPSKALAGVGVAFYLLAGLRQYFRQQGVFERMPQPNLAELLDLVALGTVADLVPLDSLNRILVKQGLARMRSGKMRKGIAALLQIAGKDYRYTASSDLSFALAPRLNAAGRLDDMSQGVMLLLSESDEMAFELASLLDDYNKERRTIQQEMEQQAEQQLDRLSLQAENLPKGLCLYDPQWHQGVVGLIASKVKERLNRPVIVFAEAEDGSLKGSGRSISGIHLRDLLDALATKHPDLLQKFGGHAMAAGLSIEKASLPRFDQAFQALLADYEASVFDAFLYSDGALVEQDLNLYLAQAIRDFPWGSALPEPLFDGVMIIHQHRVLQEKHIKFSASIDGVAEKAVEAILFFAEPRHFALLEQPKLHFFYRLDVNFFRGQQSLQLILQDIREST